MYSPVLSAGGKGETMPETLKEQLLRHEGLRLKPYKDSIGKLTVGVGRNLDDKGISKAEAMTMLENDIQDATDDLRTSLPWVDNLDWPRKAVLINMCFNLGITRLLGFKNTLMAIEDSRWQDAHDHMLQSKWAQQVGPRAIELARQMLTGEMGEG